MAYSGAIAVVVPSLAEGFGIPVIEAMACGTQILVSDIPVFREIAGDDARYFDPHDTKGIADLMHATVGVLPDDLRIGRAKQRARRFSWDASARQLGELYHELL